MSDSLPAPGGSSGSSGSLSNAKIQIENKIAESKARTLGRKMLAEYCTQMNKQMVKNVDAIIRKLDIDNQDEIFKNVAKQFFDDDLKEMYIDELKRRQTISIKKNLRGILYDHFKDDLKIEKEEEQRRKKQNLKLKQEALRTQLEVHPKERKRKRKRKSPAVQVVRTLLVCHLKY